MTIINFDTHLYGRKKQELSTVDLVSIEAQFINELDRYGLIIDGSIYENELTRVNHREKPNKKTGWYVYFGVDSTTGLAGGVFGDWRDDTAHHWTNKDNIVIDPNDWKIFQKKISDRKEKAEAERKKLQDKGAGDATIFIDSLTLATNHNYLIKKNVKPYGVYIDNSSLVVPMRDNAKQIRNYQRIYENGKKYFSEYCQVNGCYHLITANHNGNVYIVEGYATGATIHELTGCAVYVAFVAHNLKHVGQIARKQNPHNLIIFAADDDRENDINAGLVGATKARDVTAHSIVKIPNFMGGDGTDFNDLANTLGDSEALNQLIQSSDIDRGVKITRIGNYDYTKKTNWLIHDMFTNDSLVGIYGPSGGGKSFAVIDMGLCIATGQPWHGHDISNDMPVLYICGEGQQGISKRVAAWCKHNNHGYADIDFYITSGPVLFLSPEQYLDLIDKVSTLQSHTKKQFGAVICDTLNRNFGPGDENKTSDMTAFIQCMDGIRRTTGAAVIVVHHTGVAETGRARGNSSLRAALDTEIQVSRQLAGPVTLSIKKQKDGPEHKPINFLMRPITIANDEDGEPIKSIILQKTEGENMEYPSKPIKRGTPRAVAIDILMAEIAHCDRVAKSKGEAKALVCKVDERNFAGAFRTEIKSRGRKNASTAYAELKRGNDFLGWVKQQGAWLIINREVVEKVSHTNGVYD